MHVQVRGGNQHHSCDSSSANVHYLSHTASEKGKHISPLSGIETAAKTEPAEVKSNQINTVYMIISSRWEMEQPAFTISYSVCCFSGPS